MTAKNIIVYYYFYSDLNRGQTNIPEWRTPVVLNVQKSEHITSDVKKMEEAFAKRINRHATEPAKLSNVGKYICFLYVCVCLTFYVLFRLFM